MSSYRIELTPDDDGSLLVTCPRLPEVTTFGADEAEALAMAGRAVEEALAARIASGEDVPSPSGFGIVGDHCVRLGLQTAIKVSLYGVLKQSGFNRAELARRLNWHRNSVDRLFDLNHASRLDQLEAAFRALGRHVDLAVSAEAA